MSNKRPADDFPDQQSQKRPKGGFLDEVRAALIPKAQDIKEGIAFTVEAAGVTICYDGSDLSIADNCWVAFVYNGVHSAAIVPAGHELPIKFLRGKPVHPAIDFEGLNVQTGWEVQERLVTDMVLPYLSNIVKNFMAEAVTKACIDIGKRPPILKELPGKPFEILKWEALDTFVLQLPVKFSFYAQLRYVVNKDGTVTGAISFRCSTHDLEPTYTFIKGLDRKACERRLPKNRLKQNMSYACRRIQLRILLQAITEGVEQSFRNHKRTKITVVPAMKELGLDGERHGEVPLLPDIIWQKIPMTRAATVYNIPPEASLRTLLFRAADYGKPISMLPGFENLGHIITPKSSFGIRIGATVVKATKDEIWAEVFFKHCSVFYYDAGEEVE